MNFKYKVGDRVIAHWRPEGHILKGTVIDIKHDSRTRDMIRVNWDDLNLMTKATRLAACSNTWIIGAAVFHLPPLDQLAEISE